MKLVQFNTLAPLARNHVALKMCRSNVLCCQQSDKSVNVIFSGGFLRFFRVTPSKHSKAESSQFRSLCPRKRYTATCELLSEKFSSETNWISGSCLVLFCRKRVITEKNIHTSFLCAVKESMIWSDSVGMWSIAVVPSPSKSITSMPLGLCKWSFGITVRLRSQDTE